MNVGVIIVGCGNLETNAPSEINAVTGSIFTRLRGSFACMTRLARMVVPGLPHHVTQRGNRREAVFFEDGDQEIYCDMVAEQLRKSDVEVWAYCLMPNHIHLKTGERQEDYLHIHGS